MQKGMKWAACKASLVMMLGIVATELEGAGVIPYAVNPQGELVVLLGLELRSMPHVDATGNPIMKPGVGGKSKPATTSMLVWSFFEGARDEEPRSNSTPPSNWPGAEAIKGKPRGDYPGQDVWLEPARHAALREFSEETCAAYALQRGIKQPGLRYQNIDEMVEVSERYMNGITPQVAANIYPVTFGDRTQLFTGRPALYLYIVPVQWYDAQILFKDACATFQKLHGKHDEKKAFVWYPLQTFLQDFDVAQGAYAGGFYDFGGLVGGQRFEGMALSAWPALVQDATASYIVPSWAASVSARNVEVYPFTCSQIRQIRPQLDALIQQHAVKPAVSVLTGGGAAGYHGGAAAAAKLAPQPVAVVAQPAGPIPTSSVPTGGSQGGGAAAMNLAPQPVVVVKQPAGSSFGGAAVVTPAPQQPAPTPAKQFAPPPPPPPLPSALLAQLQNPVLAGGSKGGHAPLTPQKKVVLPSVPATQQSSAVGATGGAMGGSTGSTSSMQLTSPLSLPPAQLRPPSPVRGADDVSGFRQRLRALQRQFESLQQDVEDAA